VELFAVEVEKSSIDKSHLQKWPFPGWRLNGYADHQGMTAKVILPDGRKVQSAKPQAGYVRNQVVNLFSCFGRKRHPGLQSAHPYLNGQDRLFVRRHLIQIKMKPS
jgi:hypothetical protein